MRILVNSDARGYETDPGIMLYIEILLFPEMIIPHVVVRIDSGRVDAEMDTVL